jgi:hypothetical protein
VKIALQIGFRKAHGRQREGQLVRATINDIECSWSDSVNEGRWVTSPANGVLGNSWYLYTREVFDNDIIHIEVKTAMAGLGSDERRTFDSFYTVSEDFPVREICVPNVGMRGIPLVKGRVKEMGTVTKEDERLSDVEKLLEETDF